jgi:aldose sugar dehydrogenase
MKACVRIVLVLGILFTVNAAAEQAPPAATAAAGAQPDVPRGGGGRGGAIAALFTDKCAGCHGSTLTGGRVASLFDAKWNYATDDESIVRIIHDGIEGTEMESFAGSLSDAQIWQLVSYIRMQGAALQAKPTYVPDPDGQIIKSEKQTFKIEVIARNIETPWALAFLPDGRLLITERPGRLRIVPKSVLDGSRKSAGRPQSGNASAVPEKDLGTPPPDEIATVTGLPKVWEKQDGGLFDVEVDPDYKNNGWIYLSYSETLPGYVAPAPPAPAPDTPAAAPPTPPPTGTPAERGANPAAPQAGAPPTPGAPGGQGGRGRGRGGPPDPPSMTVIIRGKINKNNEWVEQQVLFRAKPEWYSSTNAHYGSRFIFDKQGHLFYTLGEKNNMVNAQDLSNPLGKIHRINADGSVPKDNPFVDTPGAIPTIWSYGHRNPQGLAWDPVTGKLWESEHGPQGGDEINIIEKGHNYGWGVITMGVQPGITERAHEGMEQPVVYYTPTIAPSGITFYTGNQYPQWKNNLFVSALGGQQLRRLEIDGDKVTHQEQVFNQFGRVHDVIVGPDGYLYVTLQLPGQVLSASTPGMIARLIPVKE